MNNLQPELQSTTVYIVDDDCLVLQTTAALAQQAGYQVTSFASGVDFLDAMPGLTPAPVLLDVRMPNVDGLAVLARLRQGWAQAPVVMMSGQADIPMAVKAMQCGAADFIEKPIRLNDVRPTIERAVELLNAAGQPDDAALSQAGRLEALSPREREVLALLVRGDQNKVVAQKLGISHRTVEVHRARIMRRLGVATFAELVRLAIACGLEIA